MKILPIFAVVIVFTALLNYALQPKEIVKHLGEESGAKGWLIALFAGYPVNAKTLPPIINLARGKVFMKIGCRKL